MKRKLEVLYYIAIAAALAILYATVGTMDFQDALIAEQSRGPQQIVIPMQRPMPCDAIVNGRCYISPSTRKALDGR